MVKCSVGKKANAIANEIGGNIGTVEEERNRNVTLKVCGHWTC